MGELKAVFVLLRFQNSEQDAVDGVFGGLGVWVQGDLEGVEALKWGGEAEGGGVGCGVCWGWRGFGLCGGNGDIVDLEFGDGSTVANDKFECRGGCQAGGLVEAASDDGCLYGGVGGSDDFGQ